MAMIEPLGSIMTVQAQNTVQTKAAPIKDTTAEDVSKVAQEVPTVDRTTNVIENPKGKNNSAYGEKSQEQAAPTPEQQMEQIRKAVEKLNKNMSHSEAVFGIHEETNRVTIKLIDKQSKEVIKELPPEKTLDMIARVWEMAGILVDEKR